MKIYKKYVTIYEVANELKFVRTSEHSGQYMFFKTNQKNLNFEYHNNAGLAQYISAYFKKRWIVNNKVIAFSLKS